MASGVTATIFPDQSGVKPEQLAEAIADLLEKYPNGLGDRAGAAGSWSSDVHPRMKADGPSDRENHGCGRTRSPLGKSGIQTAPDGMKQFIPMLPCVIVNLLA